VVSDESGWTSGTSGWRGRLRAGPLTEDSLPADLPPEVKQRILAEAQEQPLVEVTVQVFGEGKGRCTVGVRPADASQTRRPTPI
jgi:hypothetical protein